MKENKEPLAAAKEAITVCLDQLTKKVQNDGKMQQRKLPLHEQLNKEICDVQISQIVADMGHGVTRPNVLSVVNNYILQGGDLEYMHPVFT
jgi:hypothetical protein